jgi:hypothetical protein
MNSRRDFLAQTAGIALGSAVAAGCKSKPGGNEATQTTKAAPTSDAPDAFNLEVTVTGLCLFLPSPGKSKMHVLMVAPVIDHGEGEERVEPHYPRVFYDAAYDSEVEAKNFWRAVPLESTVLDLSGFHSRDSGTPGIPTIRAIKGLVDVSDYGTLGDPEITRPGNLACRLTLPRGSWETPKPSASWKIQGPPREDRPIDAAAWHVVWTVRNIKGSVLNWELQQLNPIHPVERLTPLRPGPDGMIRLLVSNTVRSESLHKLVDAPQPKPGTPMPHFSAFRDLYPGRPPWPSLIYTGTGSQGGRGTPYTCLPSGGK